MKRIIVLFLAGIMFSLNLCADEKSIKESTFKDIQEQIQNKQASMIEFGSDSCYSCKVMGKTLYKIKSNHPESNIFYLNVYENKTIAKMYGVRMIPTQIFLDKDGKLVYKNVGLLKEDQLVEKLASFDIIK